METREIKPGEFLTWKYKDGGRILVRVRYLARDYVAIFIAAATAREVLESGRNVGEQFAVGAQSLEPVQPGDYTE